MTQAQPQPQSCVPSGRSRLQRQDFPPVLPSIPAKGALFSGQALLHRARSLPVAQCSLLRAHSGYPEAWSTLSQQPCTCFQGLHTSLPKTLSFQGQKEALCTSSGSEAAVYCGKMRPQLRWEAHTIAGEAFLSKGCFCRWAEKGLGPPFSSLTLPWNRPWWYRGLSLSSLLAANLT